MSQIITATFEDGMLKPDERLDLPPRTRVRLTVEPLLDAHKEAEAALQELEQLCEEYPIDTGGIRLTRDQLHERR